jgi:hypothetical protein
MILRHIAITGIADEGYGAVNGWENEKIHPLFLSNFKFYLKINI